jgi:apolipoprotein N-acyltransferase
VCVRPDLFGLLRALLVGQGLGLVADGLVLIVFAQSVLFDVGRAASPGRIAAVLMVSLLPYSLVGPFVGVFLDRYDRRRTLVTVSASRALLVVGGAAVTAAGSVPAAYACVLLLFCLSRLALTAKGAALPRSVPSEGLVQATALSGGVGTASAFVGAFVGALGGWRIADRSAAAGFVVAGLLYAAAAMAFARLPPLAGGRADRVRSRLRRVREELAEGMRVTLCTPATRRPLLSVAGHRLLLGAAFVILVLVADEHHRLPASGFTRAPGPVTAVAVAGLAAFAGSLAAPPLAARFGAGALVPAAFLPAAAGAYVGGLTVPSLSGLIACVGVVAFAFQVAKVAAQALIGGAVSDAVRGRVFSFLDMFCNVALVVAGLVMVPWWHSGTERALLWWLAAAFLAGSLLTGRPFLSGRRPRFGPCTAAKPDSPQPRPRHRHRWRSAAAFAGALPVLAFPAPAWWWWAWVALVPLTLVVRSAPTCREGVLRTWWGMGAFVMASQYWLLPSIGPGLLLLGALLGALWLPWGWTVHRLLSGPQTGRRLAAALVVVPSAWVCAEAVRSWESLGGPWALLGATQWRQPLMLASASLGGVWLTGFLLVAANTALAAALVQSRGRLRATALLAAVGCAATGPGRAVLAPALPETGSVRIGVVQPGVTSGAAVREARQEAATARLAAYHPDLVVWAESSVGSDLTRTPGLLAGLRSLSRTVGADLLVNVDAHQAGQARRAKQSVLIGPGGVRAAYDKIRLVPFGEYIPLRPLLGGLSDVTRAAPEDRRRGRNLTIMRTGTLAVAPLVCFESAFPDMARREVGRGAQLIVYQTSTSTFQGSWAQPQHASLAAVRAAETGRPVVHAGLTGISAVFDSRGRPLAWQSPDYRGAFVVRVPLTSGTTPYLRAGDWVLALSFSTLAAASTAASLERGRRRGLPTAR